MLLYFLVFLSCVLFLDFVFLIDTWYIGCLLDVFLFCIIFFIFSYFLYLGFYLFVGAQEFWATGLTFGLY